MKIPVLESTPNIGIDWVTVTFRHKPENHGKLMNCLVFLAARYLRRQGPTFPFGGFRNGFENRFMIHVGGQEFACYAWGGNNGYASLEFRGSWCGLVDWSFWRLVRWFVRRYKCRLTRVDIAADFFQGEIDIDQLEQDYRFEPASVLRIAGRAPKLGVIDRGQGRTLYFGGRQSPREICLYEKGRQLAGDKETQFPGWVRCELRFRRHKESEIPVDVLDPLCWWSYIWGLGPAFGSHVPDEFTRRREFQRRAVQAEINARVRKQIEHVRRNYGKFLWFLSLLGEPVEVLSMVVNPEDKWSGVEKYPDIWQDDEMLLLLSDIMKDAAWSGFGKAVQNERDLIDRGLK